MLAALNMPIPKDKLQKLASVIIKAATSLAVYRSTFPFGVIGPLNVEPGKNLSRIYPKTTKDKMTFQAKVEPKN